MSSGMRNSSARVSSAGSELPASDPTLISRGFFDEAEAVADPLLPEPTVEKITYERRKQKGRREAMLANLPVETVEYRLSEEEQVCPQCGGPMHEMRVETREELKIIPAQVKLVRHERQVYACRNCQRNEERTPIVTVPMPNPVIKNSLASPSAVAYIMDQKYACGLPLYHQEQQLARIGIELCRQTMANWMIYSSEHRLEPVYETMHDLLRRLLGLPRGTRSEAGGMLGPRTAQMGRSAESAASPEPRRAGSCKGRAGILQPPVCY